MNIRHWIGLAVGGLLLLALVTAAPPVGFAAEPDPTPPPSAPGAPGDPPRPSPGIRAEIDLPAHYRGQWVRVDFEAWDQTIGDPRTSDQPLVGTSWLLTDASGDTVEYFGQFYRNGSLEQVVHETARSAELWLSEPLAATSEAPVCYVATTPSETLVRSRVLPFATTQSLKDIGYRTVDETPAPIPSAVAEALASPEVGSLLTIDEEGALEVLGIGVDGLIRVEYAQTTVKGRLVSSRYVLVDSITLEDPTIVVPSDCQNGGGS